MIKEMYNNLFREFGRQNWWPVISKNRQFEVIIGAILTQNTNWKNVEKCIKQMSKINLLSKEAIKKINENKLANIIRSSGYYKQKAKKIKKVVEFLDSGKEINRENLLGIWGIGKETADSILLYAYDKPVFVIDGYTKRIMERIGFKEGKYDELQKVFMENLEKDINLFKEYHALLVELGKKYCKKEPVCERCSIKEYCTKSKSSFST